MQKIIKLNEVEDFVSCAVCSSKHGVKAIQLGRRDFGQETTASINVCKTCRISLRKVINDDLGLKD